MMHKRPAEEDEDCTCGPCMRGSVKKSKVEKKYDPDHNDPSAKLVFETNDGVLFRVHEWYFKKASSMFANMSAVASRDTADTPMSADLSAAALRVILPLIYLNDLDTSKRRLGTVTVRDLFAIKEFVKFYDFYMYKSFCDSVEATIRHRARNAPRLVFEEASKRDDLGIAKLALACFENRPGVQDQEDVERSHYSDFENIEPRYLFELLRLRGSQLYLKKTSGGVVAGVKDIYQTDWNALSRAFNPHRERVTQRP